MEPSPELLNFYRSHSPFSWSERLQIAPDQSLADLVQVVQNHLLHYAWPRAYGLEIPEDQYQQINTRFVDRFLEARAQSGCALQDRTLPEQRHLGCCRDFSLFLTAMLRQQGIPARNRVGFAGYFQKGHWHDHVITEFWNGQRWVRVDAQLDELQRQAVGISFDPLDLPDDQEVYVTAAQAWQLYRSGQIDPQHYAVFPGSPFQGPNFIRLNLLHELWALNKRELLLWEGPELFYQHIHDLSEADLVKLDELAADLTARPESLETLQKWLNDPEPLEIRCIAPNGFQEVWHWSTLQSGA